MSSHRDAPCHATNMLTVQSSTTANHDSTAIPYNGEDAEDDAFTGRMSHQTHDHRSRIASLVILMGMSPLRTRWLGRYARIEGQANEPVHGRELTEDPDDCANTMTTATKTSASTEEPGCCNSDNVKKLNMCTKEKCQRSLSCHWNIGEDAFCDQPYTTILPGCCHGNPNTAYNKKGMAMCTGYDTERECLSLWMMKLIIGSIGNTSRMTMIAPSCGQPPPSDTFCKVQLPQTL